jgi:aminoglycoside phosphotransferase (APT) family kinase protein
MTMLPGEVDMFPSDVDDWTRQLAAALATIHETDLGSDVPAVVRRPHLVSRWRLWDIEPDERINAAVAAIRRLQSEAIIEPEVFCHNDYHPGNVLFEGGILRGVVDWSLARLAPAAADVSNARVELAIAPGGNTPQQFLGHYRKVSNAPLDRLALWDVLSGMHALEHSHRWIEAFAAVGVVLRPDEIRASV